jgi:uncharacterized protein YcfJ
MNSRFLSAALGTMLAVSAGGALAADFTDVAHVVATNPVVEQVNQPRQECWSETVSVVSPQTNPSAGNAVSPAGAIIGGVAGGVIGHQVGSGRGNDVATVAGTIVGALVGNGIAASASARDNPPVPSEPEQRVVQRCRTVDSWVSVIRAYDVTYRYAGRDATVRMSYDPGPSVRVAVGIVTEGPRPYAGTPPRPY